MHLSTLSLTNYKNFEFKSYEFSSRINCFVGPNGIGKTNILDAIYHLSFGKSYFNPIALQNIKHGEDFFAVNGVYHNKDRVENIIVSLKKGQRKTLKRNGKSYERFSDHIGLLPLVIISPNDRNLIVEGSETRRKFLDGVLAQNDRDYLTVLMQYNKLIAQRNALLKHFANSNTFDTSTLEIYNFQLCELGQIIHQKRQEFMTAFEPIFIKQYQIISNQNETVSLTYKSQLHNIPLDQLLKDNLSKDRVMQYTTSGTHKDDLIFSIKDYPIKKFGSQGQQKSFLIALKLAQFEMIQSKSETKPILLLDDIFDKLDEHRVAQIISMVDNEQFGQLFISDTHADRTEKAVKAAHKSFEIFEL